MLVELLGLNDNFTFYIDATFEKYVCNLVPVSMTKMGLKWVNVVLLFSHTWPCSGLPSRFEGEPFVKLNGSYTFADWIRNGPFKANLKGTVTVSHMALLSQTATESFLCRKCPVKASRHGAVSVP